MGSSPNHETPRGEGEMLAAVTRSIQTHARAAVADVWGSPLLLNLGKAEWPDYL